MKSVFDFQTKIWFKYFAMAMASAFIFLPIYLQMKHTPVSSVFMVLGLMSSLTTAAMSFFIGIKAGVDISQSDAMHGASDLQDVSPTPV